MHRLPSSSGILLIIACLFLSTRPAAGQAQLPFPLPVPVPGVTSYDAGIPTPEEVIGHQIGTRHTEPHEAVAYVQAVAAASDRVVMHEYARTYEGGPLIYAIVTSPANQARLEEIRQANLRLSEDPASVSDDEIARLPAVIYQGYSIHGNEASGTEAALMYLYHLAAGNGPGVQTVLDSVVVIIDPMFNPDGRGRFTTWANRNRGGVPVADPQDREHREPWPGGRTNHYWFDLNRDWLPGQHPESQGRLRTYYQWRPQVLTDHHEMGSEGTFFFQPGIPSRNNPNTPPSTVALTGEIATYHAHALDRIGSLYYSEESYDDFYYGKGSTYPDVTGAVGILFEQASSRALERETQHGVLTYAFTIRNHLVTSMSTAEAVVHMRQKLLRHQRDFYAGADDVADAYPVKAFVFELGNERTRAQALAQMLLRHHIHVYELAQDVEVGGTPVAAGDAYVVPVRQKQARLVKAMMERVTTFQDSLFYDVSAWTMPLAFDLRYGEVQRNAAGLLGAEVGDASFDGGALVGGRSDYGYLLEWGRYYAPRALYRLQEAGLQPRLMLEPFTAIVAGRPTPFGRGMIFIPVGGSGMDAAPVQALVQQVVDEDHVRIYAVDTGHTPEGPDLGTGESALLTAPRIALLTGQGTSSGNAGEVWYLLSERFGIPVSLLDLDDVGRADLSRYDTIVMAGRIFGGVAGDQLVSWVRDGGHLVALDGAADWVVQHDLVALTRKQADLDSIAAGLPYDQISTARGAQQIGGSIFQVRLDTTHPLAFGYGDTVPVFRNSTTFYEPASRPGLTVGVYTHDPLLSGYLSEERATEVPGSAAIVASRVGRGSVAVLMDDPNFRAFWWGTNGLFMNAVFFGGAY